VSMDSLTVNRRTFLKALAGGATLAALWPFPTASAQEPLVIGLQADLTGSLPDYGYWHDRVVRAAVAKLNAGGGIAGREVKLLVEDTATNTDVGRDKLTKMVQEGADFIIGSQHSGVSLASLPLAQELKTVYFPLGEATEITREAGNRYIFRANHSVRSHAQVAHRWAAETLGRKWTILVADYAFGNSHASEWPPLLANVGAEVLDIIKIPLTTVDFIPFLSQVNPNTEVLFHVFPGANALRFLTTASELGLLENMKVFGVICTVDGIKLEDVPAMEGSYYVSNHPHRLADVPESLQEFDARFREQVGATPQGSELNTGRPTTGSHYWYGWEILHLIQRAVEETGWQGRSDHPEIVRYLEGLEITAGFEFPQGDKFIRAEDHQAFHDHYLERFEQGELRVTQRMDKQEAVYDPTVDYTQQVL
jgi:branched-chain amino acid transport system substrate-binding protein